MATTIKELIETLQKYENPDSAVIWQYYTLDHFEGDITNKQFATVADKVERYEIWSSVYDAIKEQIWQLESKKGNK